MGTSLSHKKPRTGSDIVENVTISLSMCLILSEHYRPLFVALWRGNYGPPLGIIIFPCFHRNNSALTECKSNSSVTSFSDNMGGERWLRTRGGQMAHKLKYRNLTPTVGEHRLDSPLCRTSPPIKHWGASCQVSSVRTLGKYKPRRDNLVYSGQSRVK